MKIPIFKLEFEEEFIEEWVRLSTGILSGNNLLSEGKYVKKFENQFAKLTGSKHGLAITSGTTALETALKAIGVKDKEVIIPSNTFFATALAVENAGGKLVLVDCELESYSIAPTLLENKINKKTGAVILVHIGGIISPHIKKIIDICKKNKVPLVEDAAHAHGSKMDRYTAGSIGDIGCFSMFPTKVMTTGEGGMITTNNSSLYKKMRSIKNFGRPEDGSILCVNPDGNNYKINEFTGLMGYLELKRIKRSIRRRIKLVNRYVKNLKGTSYKVIKQKTGTCAYYKLILMISRVSRFMSNENERLKKACAKEGISLTGQVYEVPVHKQPKYKNLFAKESFPTTEYISKMHICPPLYPELTEAEVDYICAVLKSNEN